LFSDPYVCTIVITHAIYSINIVILREEQIKGIITRAKAKWQVEGERNTRFFCNLEPSAAGCSFL
jgi:hypothetical protein